MKHGTAMRWADALESGRYKQGFGWLKSNRPVEDRMEETFCVWGVLCDLYIQETGAAFWSPFRTSSYSDSVANRGELALVMADGVTETYTEDMELGEVSFVHPGTKRRVWPLSKEKWCLSTVPSPISIWSGASDERVLDLIPGGRPSSLMAVNDDGVSFSDLASMIRKNWARL